MKKLKLKQKWMVLVGIATSFLLPSGVLADGQNPFDAVNSGASNATQQLSTLGATVAIGMLVVAGIGLMLSQKMREWAKGHIIYVIIGIVVIVLASQAVPFIKQMFGG